MESALSVIACKQNDYLICAACKKVNWYENTECVDCGEKLKPHPDYKVAEWVEDEYEFWADEGYPELDADNVMIDV